MDIDRIFKHLHYIALLCHILPSWWSCTLGFRSKLPTTLTSMGNPLGMTVWRENSSLYSSRKCPKTLILNWCLCLCWPAKFPEFSDAPIQEVATQCPGRFKSRKVCWESCWGQDFCDKGNFFLRKSHIFWCGGFLSHRDNRATLKRISGSQSLEISILLFLHSVIICVFIFFIWFSCFFHLKNDNHFFFILVCSFGCWWFCYSVGGSLLVLFFLQYFPSASSRILAKSYLASKATDGPYNSCPHYSVTTMLNPCCDKDWRVLSKVLTAVLSLFFFSSRKTVWYKLRSLSWISLIIPDYREQTRWSGWSGWFGWSGWWCW